MNAGICAGTHTSVVAVGQRNDAGITPTIVRDAPPRIRRRPTADGSALNRVRQNASLITTEGGPPKRSSSADSVRPRAAGTPSTVKNRGDVRIASIRSGAPLVVSVTFSK